MPREQVYNQTMMILAGLLLVGLCCNLFIRPVADKWFMTASELADEKRHAKEHVIEEEVVGYGDVSVTETPTPIILVWLAWSIVAAALGWGIYNTP